jgi:hypothetical protein
MDTDPKNFVFCARARRQHHIWPLSSRQSHSPFISTPCFETIAPLSNSTRQVLNQRHVVALEKNLACSELASDPEEGIRVG